jgi:FKBP-type peptidyl-prolyl cis-trans isomerase SlyD
MLLRHGGSDRPVDRSGHAGPAPAESRSRGSDTPQEIGSMSFAPRLPLLVLAATLLLPLSAARAAEDAKPKAIEAGSTVSIEYTLALDDGSTVDTNVGGEPLVYQQGSEQILPALEKALAGMHVNDTKNVTLSAAEGYGPVVPDLVEEVDAEKIPEEARKPGAQLVSEDQAGHRAIVRVREVKGDKIVLDLNHPLAGQTLHFKIRILDIQ